MIASKPSITWSNNAFLSHAISQIIAVLKLKMAAKEIHYLFYWLLSITETSSDYLDIEIQNGRHGRQLLAK